MRHEKLPRAAARPITSRRLQAAERALRRERDAYPLFAGQIAEEQPTPEERITRHEDEQVRHWQGIRDHSAQTWRVARRILHSLPSEKQMELLERWNHGSLPGTAGYFADFIRRAVGL